MTRGQIALLTAGTIAVTGAGGFGVKKLLDVRGGGPPPVKQKAPPAKEESTVEPIAYVNKWDVSYLDRQLGEIRGRATVDWEKKRAVVILHDPTGHADAHLTADDVEADDRTGIVTMRLRGPSPSAPKVAQPDVHGATLAAAAGQHLTIKPSEPDFDVAVREKAHPDADAVTLALRAGPYGALHGEWSYRADPITRRDANGSGRAGAFRLLSNDQIDDPHEGFAGLATGREDWTPRPPSILTAIVVEEQLLYRDKAAAYAYPFVGGRSRDASQTTRTLFVAGRDLPFDRFRVFQDVTSNEPGIHGYRVVATSAQDNLDPQYAEMFDRGWAKLGAALTDDQKAVLRNNFDAALIRADLEEGVLAGPKNFMWGGAPAAWFLQFGDNTADAHVVRQIRAGEFEMTGTVFLPEQIAIELGLRSCMPLPSIPVLLGVRRAGSQELTAITKVPAVPVGAHACVFRTAPFGIGKGGTVALSPGDEIVATVQIDDVPFVAPPTASAVALLTPDRLSAPTPPPANDNEAALHVHLWKEALAIAARTHGIPAGDLQTLPGKSLEPYRGIRVTVGDHAAMLLLRATFLSMMEERLRYLDSLKTDDQVDGFREWLRPLLAENPAPTAEEPALQLGPAMQTAEDVQKIREALVQVLRSIPELAYRKMQGSGPEVGFGHGTFIGELQVTGPTGMPWKFYTTYADAGSFDRWFKSDPRGLRDWRIKATRELLAQYRDAVVKSIDAAKSIDARDTQALAKLTGIGFAAVGTRLIPTLMRLDDNARGWVPDLPARAAVANLHTYSAAVRAAEDYTKEQEKAFVEIVTDLMFLSPAVLSDAAVTAFSEIAGTGLLAWQSGEMIMDQIAARKDVVFFFGASAAIGAARLEEAQARATPFWKIAMQFAQDFAVTKFGDLLVSDEPLRIRSSESVAREGIDLVTIESATPVIRTMSVADIRRWPVRWRQRMLELAATGASRLGIRKAARASETEAIAEVRRLTSEVHESAPEAANAFPSPDVSSEDATYAKAVLEWPDAPTAQPKTTLEPPPNAAGLPKTVLEPPPMHGVEPAGVAAGSPPVPGEPPRADGWFAPKEADGAVPYYKTEPLSPNGKIAEGASSMVFGVAAVAERDNSILQGNGIVLKIVKDSDEFGSARDQIARMKEAYATLQAAKAGNDRIEFPEVLEFHENATPPYVLQRRLRFEEGKTFQIDKNNLMTNMLNGRTFRFMMPKSFNVVQQHFPEPMQRAVLQLFADLAAQRIIATDLSLPNLYFVKRGAGYVCGILDIDHLVNIKKPEPSKTWQWIRSIRDRAADRIPSSVADGRALRTSFDFMEKALEMQYGGHHLNGWIAFRDETRSFEPVFINPDLIHEYFPNFRKQLPPEAPPAPPKKSSRLSPAWSSELALVA